LSYNASNYIKLSASEKCSVIEAPPRTGKDHEVIKQLLDSGKQFVGITISHQIVKHQLSLIKKIAANDLPKVIHLEGKQRCCRKRAVYPDCHLCNLYPHNFLAYNTYVSLITNLLYKNRIVTKEDIGHNFCPFYALKFGMDQADVVLTVSQLFPILPRWDVLFIDEEEALNFFRVKSVMLLEITKRYGWVQYVSSPLFDNFKQIQKLKVIIEGEQSKGQSDKDILRLIQTLEDIKEACDFHKHSTSKLSLLTDSIDKSLQLIQIPEVKDKEKVLKNLRVYASNKEELREAIKFLEPLIGFECFYWQKQKGRNKTKLYLIADESEFFYINELRDYDKIVIVGRKEAREFAIQIGTCDQITIPTFKYERNFLVFFVIDPIQLIRDNLKNSVPQLVLCGSIDKAFHIYKSLCGKKAVALKGDTVANISDYWRINTAVIYFNNSSISRGIDLPKFDVLIVHDYKFTEPFYEACRSEDELNEKILYETLQSALRITPTPEDNESQPKILVFPKKLEREELPYIDNCRMPMYDYKQIAEITSALCRKSKVVVP